MAASSDDPTLLIPGFAVTPGGAEACAKAWSEGTDELKDLMKHEIDVIYECRYCRNLFRSIASIVSHKRTYCKSFCRTISHQELINKHLEDVGTLFASVPPVSTRKGIQRSRHNIVASLQKAVAPIPIQDSMNRVDLYTVPNISRPTPQTMLVDGHMEIIRNNPQMAIKEHLADDDRALLLMPQESNVSQHCGDMTLRRRKLGGVEGNIKDGKELMVLDYIHKDIGKHINPATCQCLYKKCINDVKPFGSLFALAYHLSLRHNRPLTTKDIDVLRKGREGHFLCFICNTTHGSHDKLVVHTMKEHADIKKDHIEQRQKANLRVKRKLLPSEERYRSISPTLSENEEEEENEDEEDQDESTNMEMDEASRDSLASNNNASTEPKEPKVVGPRKAPVVKKKKRARLTMRRRRQAPTKKCETGKDSTPAQDSPKPDNQEDEGDERNDEDDVEEEETEKESINTSESQNVPELSQQTSRSPTRTRSPSDDSETVGVALSREKRNRRPRKFLYEDIFNDEASKKNTKRGAKEQPPKKKLRSVTPPVQVVTPKREIDVDMPVLPSKAPALGREEPVIPSLISPAKFRSRQALTESILKAKSNNTTPSKLFSPMKNAAKMKETPIKSEFDNITESWVTPEMYEGESSNDYTPRKKAPYTPNALAAREGSSRRKQRLNISDDNDTNTPKRLEIEDKLENRSTSISTKPVDLSLLSYEFTPKDEELFFKPLKPIGTTGSYQCSECAKMLLSQEEGRRHMMGHVRAVRFRCALCDAGAFYCEDMRNHLMLRHCPSLHLIPEKYQSTGSVCMTAKEADELTHVVHPDIPGHYLFTSGKIVTSENFKPHRPDHNIEENIVGDYRPACISPTKKDQRPKVPILSRSNKSPSRPVPSNNGASSSKAITSSPTKESRHVTPLKLIRRDDGSSNASSSSFKSRTFKILNPPSNEAPSSSAANLLENSSSTSNATLPAAEPDPVIEPPAVEAQMEVEVPPQMEAPEPNGEPINAQPPTPPQPQLLDPALEEEPSDPIPSVHIDLQSSHSMDPIDPSPSF